MLTTFPTDMTRAAESVIAVANSFRFIRDAQGDLSWRHLDDAQMNLRLAKIACLKALQEGLKAPASSEVFMASIGGPATLAEFQEKLLIIEVKASAWNDALAIFLDNLPVSSLIGLQVLAVDGIETRHIARPAALNSAVASVLRSLPELNELVTAFEGVGA